MSIPIVKMNTICFMVMIHETLELYTPEMCDAWGVSVLQLIEAGIFFSCLLHSAFMCLACSLLAHKGSSRCMPSCGLTYCAK